MEFNEYVNGTTLNISRVYLTTQDIQSLISFLQENSYITQLSLNFNNIIDYEGIKALVIELVKLKHLTSLNLNYNGFGDEGAKVLATELPKLKHLTPLNLSSNNFSAEGIKALATELAKLQNFTSLDLRYNNIGAEGAIELIAELAALKLCQLDLIHSYSFGEEIFRKFYDYLKALPSKTNEAYKDSVKTMVFAIAQDDHNGEIIQYIIENPDKYSFLINSQDEQGHTLSHFYTHSPNMQKFLFEHGIIPEPEPERDTALQDVIRSKQSVHNTPVVKKTNFIVKELVGSIKANKDELKQAADSYTKGISELKKLYKNDQVRTKLLCLIEDEKRSVMKNTLPNDRSIPDDKKFVQVVIEKALQALETQYLRKKKKKLVNMMMGILQQSCNMITQKMMQRLPYLSLWVILSYLLTGLIFH